eukprot:m.46306 g.46306  ORF g.46306 m.46306 type:complete len:1141 (+) comp7261_c0_seq1:3-3425(+)
MMSFVDDEGAMLVDVIRQLAQSGTVDERHQKMQQLQHKLERLDDQMVEIVEGHHQSFSTALSSFIDLIHHVDDARDHTMHIRTALLACKSYLNLHHDQIRQLYLESIEVKETIRLYDDIGKIQNVPPQIDAFLEKKQFVHAAMLISSTRVKLADFKNNDAMKHLQRAIKTKYILLKDSLIQELHRQLFLRDSTTRESFDDLSPDMVTSQLLQAMEPTVGNPKGNTLEYIFFITKALFILGASKHALESLRHTRVADISRLVDRAIVKSQKDVLVNLPAKKKRNEHVMDNTRLESLLVEWKLQSVDDGVVGKRSTSRNAQGQNSSVSQSQNAPSPTTDKSIAPLIMFSMCQDVLVQLRRCIVAHACFLKALSMLKEKRRSDRSLKCLLQQNQLPMSSSILPNTPTPLSASITELNNVDKQVLGSMSSLVDEIDTDADNTDREDDEDDGWDDKSQSWWLGDEDSNTNTGVKQTPSSSPLPHRRIAPRKSFRLKEKMVIFPPSVIPERNPIADEEELWIAIQSELVRLLYPYLDIGADSVPVILQHVQKGTVPPRQSVISTQAGNSAFQLQDVLARFETKKDREKLLSNDAVTFSFANSDHAISSTAALGERQLSLDTAVLEKYDAYTQSDGIERVKYCAPTISNILGVYKPTVLFSEDIVMMLSAPKPKTAGVRLLLDEYVRQRYIGHLQDTVRQRVTMLGDGMSFASETLFEVAPSQNIISSTRDIWQTVCWLCAVMFDIPHFAKDVIDVISQALQKYLEFCKVRLQFLTKSRTKTSSLRKDDTVLSMQWLRNKDLQVTLRNTPMYAEVRSHCMGIDASSTDDDELEELNEADVDEYCLVSKSKYPVASAAESDIVWSLLQDGLLDKTDVVGEVSSLTLAAHLCESLQWLGKRVAEVVHILLNSPAMLKSVWASSGEAVIKTDSDFAAHIIENTVTPNMVQSLADISQQFTLLASDSLLFLRMELRCRALLYIIPTLKHANYSCDYEAVETDPQIVQFNRMFLSVDEALSASLQPVKKNYVLENFEGFMANLFIHGMRFISRINDNGVKRMYRNILAVQQTLRSTMRFNSTALDLAMQYYDMLGFSPTEIIDSVASRLDPPFKEEQYQTLIFLLRKKANIPDSTEFRDALANLHSAFVDVV